MRLSDQHHTSTRRTLYAVSQRLSYANVAATLALVFSMSSGALAANHYLMPSQSTAHIYQAKAVKHHRKGRKPHATTGPRGAAGANGANGLAGPGGLNGANGATGPMGAAGNSGNPGANGATGPGGPTGESGIAGATGEKGPTGATGAAPTLTVAVGETTDHLGANNEGGTGVGCPHAGEVVIAGGVTPNVDTSEMAVTQSAPELSGGKPTGWKASFDNPTVHDVTITIYAICAPGS